jgi:hypothetical protein
MDDNPDEAPGTDAESPPVLSVLDNPRPPEGANAFGAILSDPVKTIIENHNKDFVRIYLYEFSGAYHFGYQLKVGRIIRQKLANIADPPLESAEAARMAARDEIKQICGSSRFVQNVFAGFTAIMYNQPELF